MIEQDILIIGSGVAGMSAAQYAARAGRSVTVIEAIAPGGQTMYIDMIENYPGFNEPISGAEIGMKFHAQAEQFGAKLVYATVAELKKEGDLFYRLHHRRRGLPGQGGHLRHRGPTPPPRRTG
ncbi:MAG: NAD(P)/FAD-dependent oxidoreductase [Sphaerochaeta sp.]